MYQWRIDDVMTTDVIVAREGTSVTQIAGMLATHRVSGFPVVDNDNRVKGVVSQADLLPRVGVAGRIRDRLRTGRTASKTVGTRVRDLMSTPALTIAPDAPLGAAARTMLAKKVRRLIVTDDSGHLLGIVSRADLLLPYSRPDATIRRDVAGVLWRFLWIDPKQVQVSVVAGVVTLSGAVGRRTTAAFAAKRAADVPGVVTVMNDIQYNHDDTDLARSRAYRTHPFSAAPFGP